MTPEKKRQKLDQLMIQMETEDTLYSLAKYEVRKMHQEIKEGKIYTGTERGRIYNRANKQRLIVQRIKKEIRNAPQYNLFE